METHTKVTAKLIAQQLGFSIATVDRALNNRGNVKEETYNKVMEKAKELGYKPNRLASILSRNEQFTITVVIPEYPVHFWEQVEEGINKAFNELNDYGVVGKKYKIPDQDLLRGEEIIKRIIEERETDALAIAIGDNPFINLIDYGIDKGLQIATFNHDSPASKRMFYVGSDYRNAGRLAAELLCNFLGGSGNAALLTSTETSYQAQEKAAGFREVLLEYPDIQMIGPIKIDRKDIDRDLERKIPSLDEVSGIYVSNAELSSVAKYLEKLNSKKVLIGHDFSKEIYDYLQKRVITATIDQSASNQGYFAVKKLFDHFAGEENMNNKEIITKLEIITKENSRFYI
ncbi:LacI family DNA-binding transcriptional regulator [Neobacillus sp. NPDC093182]|uniref:LacI family DNA-binding transcriptional regulator n=1 Tax=Neobacillus sp. NPDC093182 TaxID=3364297 RepID=UPI0037FE2033